MEYKVVMTAEAERNLDSFVNYLLFEKMNSQAAANLLDDFEKTLKTLSLAAGSLSYCVNPRLKQHGYRRMNFLTHRYFILYRIVNETVIIDNIFHELQDYEGKLC